MKYYIDNHLRSIAHRGYSGKYEDNSILAFKMAYKRKFDMIELDIQVCKTGEIIIYHDLMIGGRVVEEMTLTEIRKHRYGTITLKEFINRFPYQEKGLYLDLKGGIKTANELCSFIMTYRLNTANIIAFSFNRKHLDILKLRIPELKRGFITSNILSINMLKEIAPHIQYLSLHFTALDEEIIDYCKARDISVFTYTMNSKEDLNYMQKFRIDGIVTNYKLIKLGT